MTRTSSKGFSLIELMTALAVGAILLVIAVPSYLTRIRESRRTEAKTALLDLAGREETLFSTTNAYSNVPASVGYTGAAFPLQVGSNYYSVDVQVPNPTIAAPSFLITATPVAGSSQVKDGQCQKFTVDQLGNQMAYDAGGANSSTTCWGS
jgi:type IV pilus assembly protein PilE